MKRESIVYVNFAPYENAGNILDYFRDNFKYVALFSFNFHHLGKKGKYNKLKIYKEKRQIEMRNLFDFQVPSKLVFLFLPIRSILIFLQIMFYSFYLRYKYGKFHTYFTVNAFTAWVGNILKNIGFVNKTVFWVWDYYPPFHQSKTVVLMRSLYWQFDKLATNSDVLIFLNQRITKLRKEIGVLGKKDNHKIIPIGTTNSRFSIIGNLSPTSKIKLVFLGVVKKSQGLDLVFDNLNKLATTYPNLEVDIIGGGPDLEYFKSRRGKTKLRINFHGYLLDKDLNKILKKSHIGLAPYIPSQENVSYYGDPSKIKKYLSYDLPVITTNVFEFSKELKRENAGILIDPNKKDELVNAIHKIIKNYKSYRKRARLLNQKYYYKKLYPKMFTPY